MCVCLHGQGAGLPDGRQQARAENMAGLALVIVLHGAALYGLWSYRWLPAPEETITLFVNFINPPPLPSKKPEPLPPKPIPQKVRLVKPQTAMVPQPQPVLAANTPAAIPADPVAPIVSEPVPEPVDTAPPARSAPVMAEPAPMPPPPAPVMLNSDLALSCPQRTPPEYPVISRRLGEQGKVVLRVELDETGKIIFARLLQSSGFKRLDEAGMAAVRTWHCSPATKNGEPVKAVALQPFEFTIEGRR